MTDDATDDVNRVLVGARDAYARGDWPGAREGFVAARAQTPMTADDILALADAAWWLGSVDEALTAGEEAYHAYLEEGRPAQAAMAATTIAVTLFLRGDDVMGSGWMSRAQRLLRDQPDCVERGFLRYPTEVEAALDGSDLDAVVASAREVQDIGRRHAEPNLTAAGTLGEGRALVRQGRVPEGIALLDEAMLAVLSDELSPEWAGNIYCHLMATCHELADFRRARVWTDAATRWLETLPAAVLFTGICRIHRSQVLQVAGAWEQAEQEAARVCDQLRDISVTSVAEGHYQLGELRRLRGDLAGAEAAYEQAHRRGRDPQPGLALLRLAQGRPDAAAASIRAALAGSDDRLVRARLCAAQVDVALAAGDAAEARRSAAELDDIAGAYRSSGLEAMSLQARATVALAEGDLGTALRILRAACRRWEELSAPYDAARVRLLLAQAYQRLGDIDGAERELVEAGAVFERLGARLESLQVAELRAGRVLPGGLTAREAEVLASVASGRTNREVAADLVISEKTVARHLSNIFTKLGVSSRTEAAAYAYAHGLAPGPRG